METLNLIFSHAAMMIVAPFLLLGLIEKTKAFMTGRKGPPTLQPFYDVLKLLNKGAVYSETTTWVFRLGPVASLSAILLASLFVPFGARSLIAFNGDAIAFAALLGLSRFVTICAALDTGWSFEGMGASREAAFSSLAEPALFLIFAILAFKSQSLSLSKMFSSESGPGSAASSVLAAVGLLIVLLSENSRIPIDDPNTHLELTMIHEALVLDHGGPDLALIHYGSALKLALMGVLLIHLGLPRAFGGAWAWAGQALGLAGLAMIIGMIESSMARLRLIRVPRLLVAAICVAAFGVILVLR